MDKLNHKPRFLKSIAVGLFLLLACSAGMYLLRSGAVTIELKNGNLQIQHKSPQNQQIPDAVCYTTDFDSDNFRIKHGLTYGGNIVKKPSLIYLTLRVPFQITGRGKLVIAEPEEGGGIPPEVFRRMMLIFPSKPKAVQLLSINDLRGRVQINTPKEALAFCRLLSSPATCYYLDGPGVEVVSKGQANLAFCFGDKDVFSCWCSKKCIGMMGVLENKSDLKRFKVNQASMKRVAVGFKIRRTLLVESQKLRSSWLVDVVETVGRDGSYNRKVIRERKLGYDPAYNLAIFHPM